MTSTNGWMGWGTFSTTDHLIGTAGCNDDPGQPDSDRKFDAIGVAADMLIGTVAAELSALEALI